MIPIYNDYLSQFKSIDFETCLKVHDSMISEIGDMSNFLTYIHALGGR